ncbi:helix-turn-helix domain-containing protein [Spirillospora sp. CA-253888]
MAGAWPEGDWLSLVIGGHEGVLMPQPPKQLNPGNGALDLFGSEVRRYRQLAGMSIAQLADRIPYSASFIGAVERAESGCERLFAEYCDRVLETKDALTNLHDGLFKGRGSAFPDWFQEWTPVEEGAVTLKSYEPTIVYGLLQTPDYANALLFGDERKVAARMERQAVLTRADPHPPRVIALIPEHVLWHEVGGPEVMYAQLEKLATPVSSRVSVQVVRNGQPHPGNSGAFVLARLSDGREIAYVETAARGMVLHEAADLARMKDDFDGICTQALPVGMSAELIRSTNERWKT